jgi:cell cycle checkpoint protein
MGGNGAPVKPRADRSSIAGGKKFVLPTSAVAGSTLGSVTSNGGPMSQETSPSGKPWAEEFAPVDLEELAVHKKKVADVQNWLVGVFSGKSRQVSLA